ncbi:sterol desaturase family protein [Tepidicaulis sp. LMO-SS28]|uniref:sterol desaturase family protein n=1 Tax=Tepidicaulis sp. LMO-SS28 TaxID=3447455 RepID=UPI003EE35631
MLTDWTASEIIIRQSAFVGVLALMLLWEGLAPKRGRALPQLGHGAGNLAISIINSVALRLLLPLLAVDVALIAAERGWGLFNQPAVKELLPAPLVFLATLLLLDLAIYAQHVAFHYIRPLWRLHAMHHVDRDVDATTGIRFHPAEILLSMIYKIALVLILGAGAWAVILFEVVLNGTAMFNHANVRMPAPLDRILRLFIVTPDMHRVHHSVKKHETNSNFGFNLSLWDRLFATYRPEPEDGHKNMVTGLPGHETAPSANVLWSLTLPFRAQYWTKK